MYVQLHRVVNIAARGEVLAVLGQTAQSAAIPARLAAKSAAASRTIPKGLPRISPAFRAA